MSAGTLVFALMILTIACLLYCKRKPKKVKHGAKKVTNRPISVIDPEITLGCYDLGNLRKKRRTFTATELSAMGLDKTDFAIQANSSHLKFGIQGALGEGNDSRVFKDEDLSENDFSAEREEPEFDVNQALSGRSHSS